MRIAGVLEAQRKGRTFHRTFSRDISRRTGLHTAQGLVRNRD